MKILFIMSQTYTKAVNMSNRNDPEVNLSLFQTKSPEFSQVYDRWLRVWQLL